MATASFPNMCIQEHYAQANGLQVSENCVQCISGLLLATLHPVLLRCIAYQSSDQLLFFVHLRTDEQCSELTQTGVIHDSLQQLSIKLIKKKSIVFKEFHVGQCN